MFIIHVVAGGTLSPKIVYTTLTLMSIVQFIITKHIPSAIMGLSECLVSCRRIQAFLELEEHGNNPIMMMTEGNEQKEESDIIQLDDVTSHWDFVRNSKTSTTEMYEAISNVQLRLKLGTLYCVIGKVGSGKSALLQTLAGELPVSSGTFKVQNITVAYAPQDPWIMNGSIRENILMGNTMDREWYRRVVDACCLDEDIERFQDGDETKVGDRGIQLSGGQRARYVIGENVEVKLFPFFHTCVLLLF
jgi:ATP-binding cassette subfamily C (CFTR/MRP) protein 4